MNFITCLLIAGTLICPGVDKVAAQGLGLVGPGHAIGNGSAQNPGEATDYDIRSILGQALGTIACPGVKGDNSTDNSATLAACITSANAQQNTAIVLPTGAILAPTLAATISGINVWLVCGGAPGACILKGSTNGVLTWTGPYGGTFNVGFDNGGAVTNTTIVVNSFGTEFINSYIAGGIGVFAALNTVGASAVSFIGTFGTPNCTAGLPLFTVNAGNGLIIRDSQISGNCAAGSVSAGRAFVGAESGAFDTLMLQGNLIQIFDYPVLAIAGNGIVIQDFFLYGNVFDNMQHGYTFTANGTGIISSVNIQDKWIGTTASTTANCIAFTGTGTVQGVMATPKFGLCGASGIVASVTTFKGATFDHVQMDGLNTSNTTGTAGINLAGGAGYSYISITNSKGGYTVVNASNQPANGITIGGIIDHLVVEANDFQGATTNYNGMLAGTTTTFAHTNTVQRGNVGLSDAPGYVNTGAYVAPTANGQASMGASAANGIVLGGQGSFADLTLNNKSAAVCQIATGSTAFSCTTITATNPIGPSSGGTGVNNGSNTITLGGNLVTAAAFTQSGAFATTLTSTATTNSTLPAGTHTLAGLDVAQTWTTNLQTFSGGVTITSAFNVNTTFTVTAAATSDGQIKSEFQVNDTEAFNASPCGGIELAAKYTSGGAIAGGGGISTCKLNTTDGDFSFYTAIYSRANGGSTSEAFRATATQGLAVGTATDPGAAAVLAAASIKSQGATSGVGYATGAGGTITQLTSRTTGVTLNTVSGDITLFSAAGNSCAAGLTNALTFTVTDSAVAATDTISLSQKSGADVYGTLTATNVAAGSFKITFCTTGGTTTEQPVFHFNVIKGVNSWLLQRDIGHANDNAPAFMEQAA